MGAHDAQQADLFDHGRAARARRSQQRVDREAFASAMFDVRSLYAKDGTLLPMHKWPAGASDVITDMEIEEVEVPGKKGPERVARLRKVKYVDKLKCQELIGRHRKMFTDLTESTV